MYTNKSLEVKPQSTKNLERPFHHPYKSGNVTQCLWWALVQGAGISAPLKSSLTQPRLTAILSSILFHYSNTMWQVFPSDLMFFSLLISFSHTQAIHDDLPLTDWFQVVACTIRAIWLDANLCSAGWVTNVCGQFCCKTLRCSYWKNNFVNDNTRTKNTQKSLYKWLTAYCSCSLTRCFSTPNLRIFICLYSLSACYYFLFSLLVPLHT